MGRDEAVYFQSDSRGGQKKGYHRHYSGALIKMLQRNYRETNSDSIKSKLEQYLIRSTCAIPAMVNVSSLLPCR